jgi:hypothetical protein
MTSTVDADARGETAQMTGKACFFSPEWAELVRAAMDAGPDEAARAQKLDAYWEWVDKARARHTASWALGVRNPPGDEPAFLVVQWDEGRCVSAKITDAGAAASATYLLSADYADWQELLAGYDPGRAVMYRKLLLEHGSVLQFFRSVYFFIESMHLLLAQPAATGPAST